MRETRRKECLKKIHKENKENSIKTKIKGEEVEGVHEALDLNRFANPLIKPMLALRVPRKRG